MTLADISLMPVLEHMYNVSKILGVDWDVCRKVVVLKYLVTTAVLDHHKR